MSVEIHGRCDPGFEAVRDAFAANFETGQELGARFAFSVEGEIVVDLWAGWADRKQTRPFDKNTLTLIFSTTKAVAATMIARLVEQGKLRYDQPVAELWPTFAANGKGAITVEQVLSHQAGLPGFVEQIDPTLWYDPAAICELLAAKAPMWTPGTASGYHALTVGYLVGEIYRLADGGRTLGTALREDITGPAGLDLWIGLPDGEHGRAADLKPPSALPDFGETTDPKRAAFLSPWAGPSGRAGADWRRIEVPSANGHATAEALARFFGALATDGDIGGVHVLGAETLAEATRERIRNRDLVLPYDLSWGAGYVRNPPNLFYGPTQTSFGHSGWGGSCAFADPAARVAGAYVMNKQDVHLLGDPRSRRLIDAAYASL
ncbi:serine hydrolase domain-containing protein [Caulobacter mirabilis]|uniref:Esterase n=1 Tax=Caulobacter mirabilis TaxID=69666 RepID=A0A2D2B2D1_9CAUL|nr:serine hydrolase domain-containing protein [Caulobacter mirabilis]ATQ44419.1 esterase [Caulobacter mirabilis]